MNVGNLSLLFQHFRLVTKQYNKTCVANGHLHITKGTREMRKARKYRRPEELEDPHYYGIGPKKKFEHQAQSIADRGFAKETPSYNPPSDLKERLQKIGENVYGSDLKEWKGYTLSDNLLKYKLLTKCIQSLKWDIQSSNLHKLKTFQDVYDYFNTPVIGCSPYDALIRSSDVPQNLVVMAQVPDFDPDKDTFFDGITAFPGRRRIIATKTGEKLEKIIEWPNL